MPENYTTALRSAVSRLEAAVRPWEDGDAEFLESLWEVHGGYAHPVVGLDHTFPPESRKPVPKVSRSEPDLEEQEYKSPPVHTPNPNRVRAGIRSWDKRTLKAAKAQQASPASVPRGPYHRPKLWRGQGRRHLAWWESRAGVR